jgi:hypothetical protein
MQNRQNLERLWRLGFAGALHAQSKEKKNENPPVNYNWRLMQSPLSPSTILFLFSIAFGWHGS